MTDLPCYNACLAIMGVTRSISKEKLYQELLLLLLLLLLIYFSLAYDM